MTKFINKEQTYIDEEVTIENNVTIYPNVYLLGNTVIKSGTIIYPNTLIENSVIGKDTTIYSSHIFDSKIGNNCNIGPYSHIRPGNKLEDNIKIGAFVEIKNNLIGVGTKISHLSYIGDSSIGSYVNVGCGVITANYDGLNKHHTIIKDKAFIGCNSVLIAPVTIGEESYVAASSNIIKDLPDNSLGIARARQINKLNYNKEKKV